MVSSLRTFNEVEILVEVGKFTLRLHGLCIIYVLECQTDSCTVKVINKKWTAYQ